MAKALSRRLPNAEARVRPQNSLFRIGQCGTGAGFSLGISIFPVGVVSLLLATRPSVTQPVISAIDSVISHVERKHESPTGSCKPFHGRLRLKCDGTLTETRFRFSAKRTSPFKSMGASVQSTTGNGGVRISGCNAGYTIFRGSVKGTGYPLHSPVSPPPRASTCAITFKLDSTSVGS
jgi:hypothetical protein